MANNNEQSKDLANFTFITTPNIINSNILTIKVTSDGSIKLHTIEKIDSIHQHGFIFAIFNKVALFTIGIIANQIGCFALSKF